MKPLDYDDDYELRSRARRDRNDSKEGKMKGKWIVAVMALLLALALPQTAKCG
jgi:hypothetical protein